MHSQVHLSEHRRVPGRMVRNTVIFASLLLSTSMALASGASAGPIDILVPGQPPVATTVTPTIVPSATCVVRGVRQDVLWFGYSNISGSSAIVPVGQQNSVAASGDPGPDGAQPDQFRPGSTPFAVAVRVPAGGSASWSITSTAVESSPASPFTAFAAAASSSSTPVCASGTATNSANVRVNGSSIANQQSYQLTNASGLVTVAVVKFVVVGAQTVCSEGGTPRSPSTLWGYTDSFGVSGVAADRQTYAPLPSYFVVRVDQFTVVPANGAAPYVVPFTRSVVPYRQVRDPQLVSSVFPAVGPPSDVLGLSAVVATADLTGRCWFPRGSAVNATAFVGGGDGQYLYSLTDSATQLHRPASTCVGAPSATCDLPLSVVGPGGTRTLR